MILNILVLAAGAIYVGGMIWAGVVGGREMRKDYERQLERDRRYNERLAAEEERRARWSVL